MRIMFGKVVRIIRDFDGTKYLVLFGSEKYDAIFDRVKYFIELKHGIKYRKIPLIRHRIIRTNRTILMGLYSGGLHTAGYIREETHFDLQSVKLIIFCSN